MRSAYVVNEHYEICLHEFKSKFDKLYEESKLPMTLKIHVIVDHYSEYIKETETNFKSTNDEHPEGIHHTVKVFK